MRAEVVLDSNATIEFKDNYNRAMQAFFYKHLESLGKDLHGNGFCKYEKREYKPFSFFISDTKIRKDNGIVKITPPFKFVVTSPYEKIIQDFLNGVVKSEILSINGRVLRYISSKILQIPDFQREINIKMMSPVICFSSEKTNRTEKTYFHHPSSSTFAEQIRNNILRKYIACQEYIADYVNPLNVDFTIETIQVSRCLQFKYKERTYKTWKGVYKLSGHPSLLKFAYDTGIGSRNPLGFGCFDIL